MAERVSPVGAGFVGIYLFFCIFLYFIEYMKKFFRIFINFFKVINSPLDDTLVRAMVVHRITVCATSTMLIIRTMTSTTGLATTTDANTAVPTAA